MTTLQQWDKYRESHPYGYGLTQFRLAIQRYRMITHQCVWNIRPVTSCSSTVAAHTRSRLEFKHTTNPERLCPKHKAILE